MEEAMESILSWTRMSRRRRNLLLTCCALGGGGYVAYRVCTSTSVTRNRRQLFRFFHSLSSLLESAAQGSDCVGVLWKDLHDFLLSSDDQVPQTLKQFFKVGQTPEFQKSVALLCMSVTEGVVSSLAERGSELQDGSDYGSALFEELSSRKERGRKIGTAGRDLGQKESGYQYWKDKRWRSSGEVDGLQSKDFHETDLNFRLNKFEWNETTPARIDDEGARRWQKEEEIGRYSALKASRNYYGERISRPGSAVGETSAESGKGKGRPQRKSEGISERLVGKLFSESGKGFASVVVASAARSLVLSVLEGFRDGRKHGQQNWTGCEAGDGYRNGVQDTSGKNFEDGVVDFFCSARGKSVIANCIETFVGTAVSTYLDKTRDVHLYEEILASVAQPAHRENVKELLTALCNGSVETLIRTSHDVLLAGASGSGQSEGNHHGEHPVLRLGKSSSVSDLRHSEEIDYSGESGRSDRANEHFTAGSPPLRTSDDSADFNSLTASPALNSITRIAFDHSPQSDKKKAMSNDIGNVDTIVLPPSSYLSIFPPNSTESSSRSQGWINGVARTLAVPSNRALVLDVAGTVSAEAVRSAIEVVVSKVSLKLLGERREKEEGQPTSKVLRVMNKTGELAQFTAAKAMIAVTMCLAICLHTLVGPSRIPLNS